MTIDKLARKLACLRPAQVRRWQEARAFADAPTRALLDQELAFEARRLLGSLGARPLLSLPPAGLARGRFHLGTILYEQPKWEFGLRASELLQGLAIFGRAGAGKTNAAFHLLLQLATARVPFLFLDWKRTVRHLLPLLPGRPDFFTPGRTLSQLAFNPFTPPPGLEPRLYAHQVVDVLAAAYTLGEGARSLLQKILVASYDAGKLEPSAKELLERLQALTVTGRARQWHVSAVRALEGLAYAELGQRSVNAQAAWVKSLLHGSTIIELDGLHVAARQFIVPTLFLWLYYVQLASPKREQLQLTLIIEEAHHVLYRQERRARESIMNTLLRQCREIGLGVVILDQHPHLIASAALGNTYCTLCLNQKDPTDINKAAALCLLDEDDKPWLSRLPVGQAIVKMQDRWRDPFVIQIPPVAVVKGSITDEVLRAYVNRNQAGVDTWKEMLAQGESAGRLHGGAALPASTDDARSAGPSDEHSTTSAESHTPPEETATDSPASVEISPTDNALIALFAVPLKEAGLELLHDVLAHPDDGVKARYKRLGWSMSRGTRIKNALLFAGWLRGEWLHIENTRLLILRLTYVARKALGAKDGEDPATQGRSGHESLAHEYWKRFYARRYAEQGYTVELEAPRPPPATGRVDILARRDGKTVAIEIETGSSNVADNVRQNQRANFRRILVVATDVTVAFALCSRITQIGSQSSLVVRRAGQIDPVVLDFAVRRTSYRGHRETRRESLAPNGRPGARI